MTTNLTFEDRVVVITGAGNGTNSRDEEPAWSSMTLAARWMAKAVTPGLLDEITAANGHPVANHDSVVDGERVVQTALDTWGRVDVLLNNAGIAYSDAFGDLTPARWKRMLEVHVDGSYHCTRAAWPHMLDANFGRILFTSSPFGVYSHPGHRPLLRRKSCPDRAHALPGA